VNCREMNAVYSLRRMKRRYEVWFLRCGLADGSGAWWIRYLLMNLGREGCRQGDGGEPVQVWATWFPREEKPRTFIAGFPATALEISSRKQLPFYWRVAENGIEEDACWGDLQVEGCTISWKLRNWSDFGTVLSDKGWIGFSKSPHSSARFSGEIALNGKIFRGEPLGYGVQGHNCGYRHRTFWRWMHAYFPDSRGGASTLEALVYDLPWGMVYRTAVWWHGGEATVLRRLREKEILRGPDRLQWAFEGVGRDRSVVEARVEGRSPGIHEVRYLKTDCSGTFPVSNASLARATVRWGDGFLETTTGAVVEMGGA